LTVGKTITFEDPVSLELTVMAQDKNGLSVQVSRTSLKTKAKEERVKKAREVMEKQNA
jgi:hypothetical protein